MRQVVISPIQSLAFPFFLLSRRATTTYFTGVRVRVLTCGLGPLPNTLDPELDHEPPIKTADHQHPTPQIDLPCVRVRVRVRMHGARTTLFDCLHHVITPCQKHTTRVFPACSVQTALSTCSPLPAANRERLTDPHMFSIAWSETSRFCILQSRVRVPGLRWGCLRYDLQYLILHFRHAIESTGPPPTLFELHCEYSFSVTQSWEPVLRPSSSGYILLQIIEDSSIVTNMRMLANHPSLSANIVMQGA